MKKYSLVILMTVISVATFAQDNKWAAGISVGYGSDISKPSIGAKVLYNVNEKLTIAPSFNYYFKDSEDYYEEGITVESSLKFWDINCDLHWNVVSNESFKFYPFAGITYLNAKAEAKAPAGGYDISVSASDGKFGANIGIGGELSLGSHLAAGLEVKYQMIDGSQVVPSLSLMYKF